MAKATATTKRPRYAEIHAASLNVCCPWCGEPQPDPGLGSDIWTIEELVRAAKIGGQRACVSCDGPMLVGAPHKVILDTR